MYLSFLNIVLDGVVSGSGLEAGGERSGGGDFFVVSHPFWF